MLVATKRLQECGTLLYHLFRLYHTRLKYVKLKGV
nr:MAG TPA: hypothetical protein [Caudoviricetes sp.]